MTSPQEKSALIRVDMQNGFFPEDPAVPGTGELEVTTAASIVANVNRLSASESFDFVVDTQDFHPANHGSFASQHDGKKPFEEIDLNGIRQTLWTDHCRQGTPGCEFHPSVDRARCDFIAQKGTDVTVDSYSGFWDNGKRKQTTLAAWLKEKNVTKVTVVGITRPFCPSFTAKDAVGEGFETSLVTDACSMYAPEMAAADDQALIEHGVKLVTTADVLGT